MAVTTAGVLAAAAVASAATGFASYQQGKKQAKKQKKEIARQRGAAETKRKSLIRQQRAQLGGAGDFDLASGQGGLTQQTGTDEVLG